MADNKKKRKSLVDSVTYAYIRKVKKWMFCPNCHEGKMAIDKKSTVWICGDCGYQLSADEFEDNYMIYFLLPASVFYWVDAAELWAATDILTAIYVIITLTFIYGKRKEITRLFNDFWDRVVPAIERGETPEKVSFETIEKR